MLNKLFSRASSSESAVTASPAMVEPLERRELLAAIVNEDKIKLRNVSAGGVSTNQSVLTIPLSEKVDIADANLIQVRGYAVNPISGAQKKLVINITDVQVLELGQDYGLIQITTDRLMRKGGRIYFYAGSLTHQADDSPVAEQIVRSPKGQNKERFTLASRAFKPTDLTKFNKVIYSDAPTPTVADGAVSDATARAALQTFLQKKVDKAIITAAELTAALARYDNVAVQAIVPDHNLRAAILSLNGTVAEPAIGAILDGENLSGVPYASIRFGATTSGAVIADAQVLGDGRLEIVVKTTFSSEPFQVLSAILAHEVLHQDTSNGLWEETVSNIFEAIVWAQQLDVDAAPASTGTALVTEENIELLALLNSGRTLFPILGPIAGPIRNNDRGVFYGGKAISEADGGQYTSWENYVTRQYLARGAPNVNTLGNPTLDLFIENTTGLDQTGPQFARAALFTVDGQLYPTLTNPMAIRVAGILKLTV